MKPREELEKLLKECPVAEYEEVDGLVVKKVSPLQTYNLVRHIGYGQSVMAKFLLHIDDKMEEHNGYGEKFEQLETAFKDLCSNRDETCPLKPFAEELRDQLALHLTEEEREKLIVQVSTSAEEKWKEKGATEERERFERAIKIIGVAVLIITTATGLITWFFDVWRF